MKKISLYVNGEIARIEDGERFLLVNDWDVLASVTKEEFIDFLQNTISWAANSWSQELRDQYQTMCQALNI